MGILWLLHFINSYEIIFSKNLFIANEWTATEHRNPVNESGYSYKTNIRNKSFYPKQH